MANTGGYPDDWDSQRRAVYERDKYTCQRCGAKGGPRGDTELHAHHETPISDGGSHAPSNLTTLCKSCHEAVHGHPIGTRPSPSRRSRVTASLARVVKLVVLLVVSFGVGLAIVYFDLVQVIVRTPLL